MNLNLLMINKTSHLYKVDENMKTHRLISMTDFVLENAKQPYVEGTKYIDLVNYAKFLKQPLKLEMFVPCDEEGNIISKFYSEKENTKNLTFSQLSNQYQIAETKVLFEGIEFRTNGGVNFLTIKEDTFAFFDFNVKFKDLTIEYLIQYNLQLTENALKQIGL